MKIHTMKSLCLLAVTFSVASAVSAADLKVGTVDVAKAFSEYYKTKDANAKLQENANKAKEELHERFDALKKLHDHAEALTKESQDTEISVGERVKKRAESQSKIDELRLLDKDIHEFQQRRTEQLKKDQTQQSKGLYDEILKVITEKSKAHGYDLVLDRSGASASPLPFPLQAKESVATTDFTVEVLAELNKNAPAGVAPAKP